MRLGDLAADGQAEAGILPERLAGRLVSELRFSTIEEVFEQGLHNYLDVLQQKLNDIGNAAFQTYIFQSFSSLEEEILVQQEEQQQQ